MGRAKTTAYRYDGSNEHLNRIIKFFPNDVIWIVNGVNGRRPITAKTMEEAIDVYEAEESKWDRS